MVDFLCWASILKHESMYTERERSVQQEEKWSSRKREKGLEKDTAIRGEEENRNVP